MMERRCLDQVFFDKLIYSIFYSINKVLARDTDKVISMMGEMLLNELYDELSLGGLDLRDAMERVADYLVKVGFMDSYEFRWHNDNELVHWSREPATYRSAWRLRKEGLAPANILTSLITALLRRYGYRVEVRGERIRTDGRIEEVWSLIKI